MTEQSAPSFKLWWLSINTNRDCLLFMIPYRFIPVDKRVILHVMLDGFIFLLTRLSPTIIVRLKLSTPDSIYNQRVNALNDISNILGSLLAILQQISIIGEAKLLVLCA
jgi:hypothetical protein